jgi:HD superfamily phosphohydrolase
MYWQVYLHKTVLAAEQLLVNILKRAKELALSGNDLFASPPLKLFLVNNFTQNDLVQNPTLLDQYAFLDDYDIYAAIKVWVNHPDVVLARMCKGIVDRKLYKIRLRKDPFSDSDCTIYREKAINRFNIKLEDLHYFVFTGNISNYAYNPQSEPIKILNRDGSQMELTTASDQLEVAILSSPVHKNFLCCLPELIE